jgi:hypothetical protein
MLPIHLALVSMTDEVSFGELAKVSAALQKQVVRDFGPIWTIEATVDPFAALEDVPVGYWKILVVDTFENGGQHRDRNNQPYALVAAGSSWSLVASHEALEMLADPFGNRLVAGPSPVEVQGRVEFLVEVCDPCQSDDCAYGVNGVMVSDFCTPSYFDPVGAAGVRYSYTGAISEPRQVLPGGYLSWRIPASGDWFQKNWMAAQAVVKDLGQVAPGQASLRAMIDRQSLSTRELGHLSADRPAMTRALGRREAADAAAAEQAGHLRELLAKIRKRPQRGGRIGT